MNKFQFTHEPSGLSRTIRVLPRNQAKGFGLSHFHYQWAVPCDAFPDVEEEKPGMPVLEVKVRCCRKHHRILLWPDGRLTLADHQGKRAKKAMDVGRAMGMKYRCADVMNAYIDVCRGRWDADKSVLPAPLLKAAYKAKAFGDNRKQYRYSLERKCLVPSLRSRAEERRLKVWRNSQEAVFGPGSQVTNRFFSRFVNSVQHCDDWFVRALSSGILASNLSIGGNDFFPNLIPPNVLVDGIGFLPATDQNGGKWWIEIHRDDSVEVNRHKGEKPNWTVLRAFPERTK